MQVQDLPLNKIRPQADAMRGAKKKEKDYEFLRASIKANKLQQPIQVKEAVDPETQEKFYEIVNGVQRFSCVQDIGVDSTIPCIILEEDKLTTDMLQIVTNAAVIRTTPAEYAKKMLKIMEEFPQYNTPEDMAVLISRDLAWVKKNLGLTKLDPKIQELLDKPNSPLPLTTAYELCKLKAPQQLEWLDRALNLDPETFKRECNAFLKEERAARREGREVKLEYSHEPTLRKKAEIVGEMNNPQIGPGLIKGLKGIEIWTMALKWATNSDPASIDEKREAYEARLKKEQEDKERRARESKLKKAQKLEEQAAQAKAEVATA